MEVSVTTVVVIVVILVVAFILLSIGSNLFGESYNSAENFLDFFNQFSEGLFS